MRKMVLVCNKCGKEIEGTTPAEQTFVEFNIYGESKVLDIREGGRYLIGEVCTACFKEFRKSLKHDFAIAPVRDC